MKKPIYLQIADHFAERIHSGELAQGSILPTEEELQQKFAVSRVTIRKAMQVMVDNDLLHRQRGSGTYVKAPKIQHDVLHLHGFVEEISKQGKKPSSEILTFEVIKASELVAKNLKIAVNEEVYSIRRLRLIDDEPEVLEHTFLPVSLFPDLSIGAMRQSKYHYIEKIKGLKIKLSRQSIQAENANTLIANVLRIKEGQAMIRVDSVGELDNGMPFEFSLHYFRGFQYSFDYISYRQ